MKKAKLIRTLITLFAVLVGLAALYLLYVHATKTVYFSVEDTGPYRAATIAEIESFEGECTKYTKDVYFNTLSKDEQRVYKILQYAMENQYTDIYMSRLQWNNSSFDLGRVISALALDSPLLEQSHKEISGRTKLVPMSFLKIPLPRVNIQLQQFSEQNWDKKMQAVSEAKRVVSTIPESVQGQWAIAKYLYDYLHERGKYIETEQVEEDALYQAMVEGASVCDGFTNALALLWDIAGIEGFEKMASAELPQQAGHTWNAACLDGVWYNFDVTGDIGFATKEALWFALSDSMMQQDNFAGQHPACTDTTYDFAPFDAVFAGKEGAVKGILKVMRSLPRGSNSALFAFTETEAVTKEVMAELMQTVANNLHKDLSYTVTTDTARLICWCKIK